MEAMRQVVKPHNHVITLRLPDFFGDDEVEIIILPKNKKNLNSEKKDFAPRKIFAELCDIAIRNPASIGKIGWTRDELYER